MQNNKFLSRDKTQALIDELKVTKAEGGDFLKSLANKGYTIEGYNDQPAAKPEQTAIEKASGGISDILKKRGTNISNEINRADPAKGNLGEVGLRSLGELGAGVADVVAPIVKPVLDNVVMPIADKVNEGLDAGMSAINKATGGPQDPNQQEVMKFASEQYNSLPEDTRKNLEAGVNSLNLIPATQVLGKGSKLTSKTIGTSLDSAKKILANSDKVSEPVLKLADSFLKPTAEDTTLTALAPFKANISPTTKVSVPVGKTRVMKEIGKLTDEEKQAVKGDILTKYQTYYDQGLKATTNAKEITPADMVAKSVDTAVKQTNKIRKDVGAKMGEVENAAQDVAVDLTNTKSIQGLVDSVTANKTKAGYAGSKKLTEETKQFLKDLDTIQKRGASVKEVLDFTRQWQNKLENLKDKFGGFTKDKFDLGNIQAVVKDVKDQARNTLSKVDENYKGLVKQYRETSQLRDTANRLLGEEGLYGDTLKGASVVKRAVKSISDAGSRQFLKKLEDLTGYDGLSDAQIAIKAMQDAGDFRGLSLLEILKETGGDSTLAGLAVKLGKSVVKRVVPTEKTKVEKFIKKD